MPSYHLRVVSHKKGRTAIPKIAYRSRSSLTANITQKKINFSSRSNELAFSQLLIPSYFKNLEKPDWLDRESFWNYIDLIEKRKNGRIGKEIVVALPVELSLEQNIRLVSEFSQFISDYYGVLVDINIHQPIEPNPYACKNIHCHIMISNRRIKRINNNQLIISSKINPIKDKNELKSIRKIWESVVNFYLEKNGIFSQVSCESLKNQGIQRTPRSRYRMSSIVFENQTGSPCRERLKYIESLSNEFREYCKDNKGMTHNELFLGFLEENKITEGKTIYYLISYLNEINYLDIQSLRSHVSNQLRYHEERER